MSDFPPSIPPRTLMLFINGRPVINPDILSENDLDEKTVHLMVYDGSTWKKLRKNEQD